LAFFVSIQSSWDSSLADELPSKEAAVLSFTTPPPNHNEETMTIALKLDGMHYVSYVRVECDFSTADFADCDASGLRSQKSSQDLACFIAISFVNMDRGAELFSVINGHTFNLLTTAHSSKKVCYSRLKRGNSLCLFLL
jgi:hypothetical protein